MDLTSNVPVKYYCEYCGSELLDPDRCPIEDCVHNVILDVLAEENKTTEIGRASCRERV